MFTTFVVIVVLAGWFSLVKEHGKVGWLPTLPLAFFGGVWLIFGSIVVIGMHNSPDSNFLMVALTAIFLLITPMGVGYGLLAWRRSLAQRQYANAVAYQAQFERDVQDQLDAGY